MVEITNPASILSAIEGNGMREDWVALVNMDYSGSYNLNGVEVSRKECWAKKLSAVRGEFYAAEQSGHNIEAVFEVSPLDYSKQQVLVHGCDTFTIVRGFVEPDKLDAVQLSCERRETL